jgi:hypothetical protein
MNGAARVSKRPSFGCSSATSADRARLRVGDDLIQCRDRRPDELVLVERLREVGEVALGHARRDLARELAPRGGAWPARRSEDRSSSRARESPRKARPERLRVGMDQEDPAPVARSTSSRSGSAAVRSWRGCLRDERGRRSLARSTCPCRTG